MESRKDYLQEVQKFTTSHYWNSGVRITSGVIVPLLIMLNQGWLSSGIPFLFGALFVSLTDTPGPIHHRRNGMLVATAVNTVTVLITSLLYGHELFLMTEVALLSFLFSLLGIYGARAGAIGTLALVIMLIHMSPMRHEQNSLISALLTAGGGLWYAALSLVLYRLQPYRLAEQALGENLMLIASYIRARGAFYKKGTDVELAFDRVMKEQVEVLRAQTQLRELLFKTRQFVGDASPKSRSIMMIFLESLDLFEETMYSYQDYKLLHEHVDEKLLNTFYRAIIQVVAEFELIGLSVQAGIPIKKMPALSADLDILDRAIQQYRTNSRNTLENQSLLALRQTLSNLRSIAGRLSKIVLYTRMEAHDPSRFPDQELEKPVETQPFTFALLRENLTFRSNTFRYALRITVAMLAGYAISALFSLSHAYWVMLTIITILKPVYHLTRERNIQRVLGTLGGVVAGSALLFFISNNTLLVVVMIFCMLMAYSLLRINYLGFVTFLTIYILITFHFLDPVQFKSLIGERLIDTLIGSVIAGIVARFIFPVWQRHQIQSVMKKSLLANATYFLAAWNATRDSSHTRQYSAARNQSIVALTNLSDHFQQMLAEPGQSSLYSQAHQFVIASHTLTSRISALSAKDLNWAADTQAWVDKITDTLQQAVANLDSADRISLPEIPEPALPSLPSLHPLSIIFSLAHDIRTITAPDVVYKNVKG
jgi:uncharacterized membrane protein YccC